MRGIIAALAATTLVASPSIAAAPCKDANGKFIKCPPAAKPSPMATMGTMSTMKTMASTKTTKTTTTTKTTNRCRNAKGQFAKCGTPGAKPA